LILGRSHFRHTSVLGRPSGRAFSAQIGSRELELVLSDVLRHSDVGIQESLVLMLTSGSVLDEGLDIAGREQQPTTDPNRLQPALRDPTANRVL
jgi:hypothetical protein